MDVTDLPCTDSSQQGGRATTYGRATHCWAVPDSATGQVSDKKQSMALQTIFLPEELGVRLDDIFRPVSPDTVPEIAGVLQHLAAHDSDVLAAVEDVDRSLILAALQLSPRERLHQALQIGLDLDEMAERLRQERAARQAV
jgi:hypothetical protein